MQLAAPTTFYHDLTSNEEGQIAGNENGDTFTVDTGKLTGRSYKWIVVKKGSASEEHIDWGSVNQTTTPEVF